MCERGGGGTTTLGYSSVTSVRNTCLNTRHSEPLIAMAARNLLFPAEDQKQVPRLRCASLGMTGGGRAPFLSNGLKYNGLDSAQPPEEPVRPHIRPFAAKRFTPPAFL